MNSVYEADNLTFDHEVRRSQLPVLVDFYAPWCGPCRALGPTLEKLAAEFAGRAKIVKVNVDESPDLAREFHVSCIPALAFISGGQVVGQTAGLLPESALRNALDKMVEHAHTA